jgi:Fe-S-cluster containining protein
MAHRSIPQSAAEGLWKRVESLARGWGRGDNADGERTREPEVDLDQGVGRIIGLRGGALAAGGTMTDLLPILDAALADTTARSGGWLACRPGCHACCVGVFAISQRDVVDLRAGIAAAEPAVAARIRGRAVASWGRLSGTFPGDASSGVLFTEPEHEEAFEEFGNDEVCPVLDPVAGTCEMYAARPVQCRTFGPPVRDADDHLTVCELCFVDAPAEEVARCEMDQSWRAAEEEAIEAVEGQTGVRGETVVAFVLASIGPEAELEMGVNCE